MTSVLKRASKKASKPQESATGKTWLHPAESLQQGSVVYAVKFLGLTDVAQAKGTEIVREAIKKVKFANHIKKSEAGVKGSKLKKVELKISIDNIKVEDVKTKEALYSYPLHRISYCADDKRDKKVFAFIAKDSGAQHHNCYVFECEKMAEELTLTVGQAFDLAYRRFLEKKALNQNSQKKLTEMEEKIKTAEEEKEALKQKIAELEIAAKQGPPSSNGSNEGNQSQSDLDEFDLLGSFGGNTVMPPPPLQEAFLQETAPPSQEVTGNEMIFDPFADIPSQPQSQPQTTTPTSPDFNEFSLQPMVEPAPRPAGLLGLLPPPPTKESVKAANRLKSNSGNVSAVTSPTVTSPMATAAAAPPPTTTSQPAHSDDLLKLSGSSNPFSSGINGTNPFADHVFDPLASKDACVNGSKEINQNIEGFPGDLALY